jgi:hypothetical protein
MSSFSEALCTLNTYNMSSSAKTYAQSSKTPGRGGGEAPHPFAVAVEAPQEEALIPEG